jgi:uncharacterized membrane protein
MKDNTKVKELSIPREDNLIFKSSFFLFILTPFLFLVYSSLLFVNKENYLKIVKEQTSVIFIILINLFILDN